MAGAAEDVVEVVPGFEPVVEPVLVVPDLVPLFPVLVEVVPALVGATPVAPPEVLVEPGVVTVALPGVVVVVPATLPGAVGAPPPVVGMPPFVAVAPGMLEVVSPLTVVPPTAVVVVEPGSAPVAERVALLDSPEAALCRTVVPQAARQSATIPTSTTLACRCAAIRIPSSLRYVNSVIRPNVRSC